MCLSDDIAGVGVHDHGYEEILDALDVAGAVPEAPCDVCDGADLREFVGGGFAFPEALGTVGCAYDVDEGYHAVLAVDAELEGCAGFLLSQW
jgi:hypothetical protein